MESVKQAVEERATFAYLYNATIAIAKPFLLGMAGAYYLPEILNEMDKAGEYTGQLILTLAFLLVLIDVTCRHVARDWNEWPVSED